MNTRNTFKNAVMLPIMLLLACSNHALVLAQERALAAPHASATALQRWWENEGPKRKSTPNWEKAKVRQTTRQRCKNQLAVLMKGMEYLRVTLFGNLQSLDGTGTCWAVTVPVEGNFTGYKASAIVSCIDTRNNSVLVVYLLPK